MYTLFRFTADQHIIVLFLLINMVACTDIPSLINDQLSVFHFLHGIHDPVLFGCL
jgi:hypothetical protein